MPMKANVAARLGVGLMLLSLSVSAARADTLVVGGRRSQSPVSFVVVGDEIYAPLLPALDALNATHQLTPDQIRITTANGREILIDRRRPQASRDGMLRDLPGPPLAQRGALLLPARAVGSLLGCAVRWDQSSRTLYLHPWIRRFALEVLSDRYRLTVVPTRRSPTGRASWRIRRASSWTCSTWTSHRSRLPTRCRTAT